MSIIEPVVYNVDPTEESVEKSPQQTVIDLPAQQRRDHRADTAEDAAATATTPPVRLLSH